MPGELTPKEGSDRQRDGDTSPQYDHLSDSSESDESDDNGAKLAVPVVPDRSVTRFYHETGVFQKIARATTFENATLSVIALNAVWISLDTDLNNAEIMLQAEPPFQVVEHFFCIYFFIEWFVRWSSFKKKRNGFRDAWFVFDSCLVFTMVMETWVMNIVLLYAGGDGGGGLLGNASILRIARLLRLSRMARMGRLFRAMPELLILVKGIVAATHSVFLTLCLLAIVTYVFGIAFRQMLDNTVLEEEMFPNVLASMHVLLLNGALLDNITKVVDALGRVNGFFVFLFYVYILLAATTIMNMLIGILCEVVSNVSKKEREGLTVKYVQEKLTTFVKESLGDGTELPKMKINKEMFVTMLLTQNADSVKFFRDVDVDIYSLWHNRNFIFKDEHEGKPKELSFQDFVQVILDQRGTNIATLKDIVDLKKFLQDNHEKLRQNLGFSSQAKRKPMQGHGVLQPSSSSMDWSARNGERDRNDHDCIPGSEYPPPRGEISLSEQRIVLAKSLMNAMADVLRLLDRLPPTTQGSSEESMSHDTEADFTHSVESNNVNNYAPLAHDVENLPSNLVDADEGSDSAAEEPDQCNMYQPGYVDTGAFGELHAHLVYLHKVLSEGIGSIMNRDLNALGIHDL